MKLTDEEINILISSPPPIVRWDGHNRHINIEIFHDGSYEWEHNVTSGNLRKQYTIKKLVDMNNAGGFSDEYHEGLRNAIKEQQFKLEIKEIINEI